MAGVRRHRIEAGRRGAFTLLRTPLPVCSLVVASHPLPGLARRKTEAAGPSPHRAPAERDGQHDFDWEIGNWMTHLRRLRNPLSGSTTWVEYD